MEASITLWEQWQEQLNDLLPEVQKPQKKALALSVLGIVLSGSAVLPRMAESLYFQGISPAKMPSIERRLARFVANERIEVSTIWKQFLSHSLPYWKGKAVRVILDGTSVDERASIVYVGLLVHSRVLPLAWRVMPMQEHWGEATVGSGGRTARLGESASLALRVHPHCRSRTGGSAVGEAVSRPLVALCATRV